MKWVELSVEVHPEAVDAVSEVFQRNGTGGVAIEQPIQSHIEGEEPPRYLGRPIVRAYLPLDASEEERVRRIDEELWHLQAFDLSPVGAMRRQVIAEEDWAESWKEHFHPLQVGRIVIKPTWREWEAQPGQIIVELDPGMAFGTGLHPSTRLMLDALQQHVKPGMTVLDLGTGSGILAISAARLGAAVTALDTSSVAVEVARTNVEANRLSDRVTVGQGSIDAAAESGYSVILANIIASVLIDLAAPLAGALHAGGVLLASGIIDERVHSVADAFSRAGLEVTERRNDEDWWMLAALRQS